MKVKNLKFSEGAKQSPPPPPRLSPALRVFRVIMHHL